MTQKHIVILGGGVAGISASKLLGRKFGFGRLSVSLISEHTNFTYTPDLYEVACSSEDLTSQKQITSTVQIPLAHILKGTRVQFIHGRVEDVDYKNKQVSLLHKKIQYDALVDARGSGQPKGEQSQQALDFRTLPDALRIRNAIAFAVHQYKNSNQRGVMRVLVIGAGCVGVELSCELTGLLDFLAWENQIEQGKLEVVLVEAQPRVLPHFLEPASRLARSRLSELGVVVHVNSPAIEISQSEVVLQNGDVIATNVVIWAGGNLSNRPSILSSLQSTTHSEVFFAGSRSPRNSMVLNAFAEATRQGHTAGLNAIKLLSGLHPEPFLSKPSAVFVSLGQNFTMKVAGDRVTAGCFPFIQKSYQKWKFFADLLGIKKATHLFLRGWKYFDYT